MGLISQSFSKAKLKYKKHPARFTKVSETLIPNASRQAGYLCLVKPTKLHQRQSFVLFLDKQKAIRVQKTAGYLRYTRSITYQSRSAGSNVVLHSINAGIRLHEFSSILDTTNIFPASGPKKNIRNTEQSLKCVIIIEQ